MFKSETGKYLRPFESMVDLADSVFLPSPSLTTP
jgi:hypothetical protein